jgi:PAS domain S-box-containing protein
MSTQKNIIHDVRGLDLSMKFACLIIIQLFFLCLGSAYARGNDRTVIVGVYENAPKIFTSESDKPSGIFIDIIEQIAKTEEWTLRYVHGTWTEGLDRLKKGEIDLMPDVAYTADREKIYGFHKLPVLSSWYQIYAPKGSKIQSILDLKEKRILVLERSVQQEAFAKLSKGFGLNSIIIPLPDYNSMFEMIAQGKADAAITNRFYGMMHAKKYDIEDTNVIFEPSDLFFASVKGDPKNLLNAVDIRLSDMKKDSQSIYYKSLKRWTSEEVQFKLPVWLQIVALIVGVALLMSVVGSFILKQQVNARTRELHAAMQRFVDIVEFLPDATFVIDRNNRVIAWNKAIEIMTGVKKIDILGKGNYEYSIPFYGKKQPILIDLFNINEKEIESKYIYVKREGKCITAEIYLPDFFNGMGAHFWVTAAPLLDLNGNRSGAIEVVRNITEQKRIEEALRTSERKYRELVMLANTIILHWSCDGQIIFMNEFGQHFFGYTESELVGRHVVGTIVPENDSTGRDLRLLIKDILSNTNNFERHINENMLKNGERVWIDWANRLVLDELGQVKEILSIGSDITERKKAEEQVRRLNDELKQHAEALEKRVTERTMELAEAMGKAQAADKIKSAFLATMSHELRTPLNSIIGFTGILLQGLAGPLNDEQNKQLIMVQNSSRHLLSLINDVLDISKIEAGQLELLPKSFQLKPSIEKMVKLISPLAEKKNLGIQLDIAKDVGMITADQLRLEQVILNLLNNAVKFTDKGYINIICRTENDLCILSVSDTGIGMQPEEIPKLFQPFHQIDTGTARKSEGTGLGLSICRKILDMMGGSIDVQSKPGAGSTFTIRFPGLAGGLS